MKIELNILYDVLKDLSKGIFKFAQKKHNKDLIKKNLIYICEEITNGTDTKQFHEEFPTEMAILKKIKLLPYGFNGVDDTTISEYRNMIKQEISKISEGHYDKQIDEVLD